MVGACIIEGVSLCLKAWSIIENKVEYKRFMSQLKCDIEYNNKYTTLTPHIKGNHRDIFQIYPGNRYIS